MSISPPSPSSSPLSTNINENVHIDLIDFHVESPSSPKPQSPQSIHCEITIPEEDSENLIDTELPVFEQKLQTAPAGSATTSRRNSSIVDVEEILISIESDQFDRDSLDGEEVEQDTNNNNGTVIDNIEALLVLKNLDDILNATLDESNSSEDDDIDDDNNNENESEDSSTNNDENVQQVIEDCLEDLDNYLKAIDDYDSETNGSNASDYSDEQSTTKESSSLSELTGSRTLSESIEENKVQQPSAHVEFNEELIRNKLRQIEENYSKFVASGIINRGYINTENFTVEEQSQRRPSSACATLPSQQYNRKRPIRATTLAVVRKKHRPRLLGRRKSLNDENNSSPQSLSIATLVRTSGTDAIASTPEEENWLVRDVTNTRQVEEQRHGCASGDCCTGTVIVEPLYNRHQQAKAAASSSSTLDINELPKEEVVHDIGRGSNNWLRNSMRRLQQLNLPNTDDNETTITTADTSTSDNLEVNSSSNVRPLSAPSRLAPSSTASTVRSSRSRSRNSVSQEPNGRARSSSASSHSRRPRSLSSSVTSLASSVESTPSCIPATETNRNRTNQQETNNRRYTFLASGVVYGFLKHQMYKTIEDGQKEKRELMRLEKQALLEEEKIAAAERDFEQILAIFTPPKRPTPKVSTPEEQGFYLQSAKDMGAEECQATKENSSLQSKMGLESFELPFTPDSISEFDDKQLKDNSEKDESTKNSNFDDYFVQDLSSPVPSLVPNEDESVDKFLPKE